MSERGTNHLSAIVQNSQRVAGLPNISTGKVMLLDGSALSVFSMPCPHMKRFFVTGNKKHFLENGELIN